MSDYSKGIKGESVLSIPEQMFQFPGSGADP